MIGKVICKNLKIWLKPKAPKPESQERSHLVKERAAKLPKAKDLKTRKSPNTAGKDGNT